MAEPEDVLIDAARRVVTTLSRLKTRAGDEDVPDTELKAHRGRLALLLAALHDRDIPVRVSFPPARPSFLRRLFGTPKTLLNPNPVPATDGLRVFLPQTTPAAWPLSPSEWFRVLALLQAERARRGVPSEALTSRSLVRHLFLMSEARAAEESIRTSLPGMSGALTALRSHASSERPSHDGLKPLEQRAESLYQAHLDARTAELPPFAETPDDSLRWANTEAKKLETASGDARYRGLKSDAWMGEIVPPAAFPAMGRGTESEPDQGRIKTGRLARRPEARLADDGEDDQDPGMLMLQMDDPHEHVEDPMGMQRPADREAGNNPDDTADSLSELPEARLVATPDRAKEVFTSDDPPDTGAEFEGTKRDVGLSYPEWDFRRASYREGAVTVRVGTMAEGDSSWAQALMQERRALFGEVKKRFEGLKPRRRALRRQWSGDEPDLDACVEAMVERHAGRTPDERLYIDFRPARRDMAVLLLVDVSGSTDAWVSGRLRVVDVEKEALLLCTHALRALGDPFAIQAFSGEGPHGVHVWSVKAFEDTNLDRIHARIASLEPETHTRLGAALRHATATLADRTEMHRLLIVLSDGRPHDMDAYSGRYGVEDARQAVMEAMTEGIHAFCLTVDRDAPAYVGHIFGPAGAATLSEPRELSRALLEVLRQVARQ